MNITLISHALCPYVQRAVISLHEKQIPFERIDIDLANKPDWFLELSPLGKTPVLKVDDVAIFESNVILEFLEDTLVHPLHPKDPLEKARHRSLIELSSALLSDIAGFYAASDEKTLGIKLDSIRSKLAWLEAHHSGKDWYGGDGFSLVDAVYGAVFRYFDTFEKIGGFMFMEGKEKLIGWRERISQRPSVRDAVSSDYPDLLWRFLENKKSHLAQLMKRQAA